MTEFTISLAGYPIRVEALFESTKRYCKAYLTGEEPQVSVCVTEEDIAAEHEKARLENELEGLAPHRYSDAYLETLALYRKITAALLAHDILLFHGSVMGYAGKAYLFTAPSGTGKTTHSRLWLSEIPGSYVLNGDKPLLRIEGARVLACGTPWQGKEKLGRNETLPLAAICVLRRDSANHIRPLTPHDALPVLIGQSNRPREAEALLKTLSLIDRLSRLTALYELGCNMEPEAAHVSFDAMVGGDKP